MNLPPETFVRVPHGDIRAFVSRAARAVGLPDAKALLLADLLTANDLRGVFSHGSRQIATYAILMRDGRLNSNPQVHVAKQTPVSLLVDGDGGLGYFPAHEGTKLLIEKARAAGIAVLVTRNHGHFGAAGIYSRMTLEHDLLAFVTSGHQLNLQPGDALYKAAGGSPMSFSAPAHLEPPLVLDFGAMHDLYDSSPYREAIARLAPGLVLRSIGTGAICQTWGGFLGGVPLDESRAEKRYVGANQGSLVIAFQIGLFMDPLDFRREIDAYSQRVRTLRPLAGFAAARLAGGPESEREAEYRELGIPVGPEHREALDGLATELGIEPPWG